MNREELVNYLYELYPDAKCELMFHNEYELLIAVILSAQTTDIKVNKVTEILFDKYHNFDELSKADYDDLYNIIHPLGLAKGKTNNIIQTANKIVNLYGGQIPRDKEIIKTLPGVGEKVAAVFLGTIYGDEEFPVDTHIFRIAKRLELSDKNTPERVSSDLKEYFKNYDYMRLHHTLIFFGRRMCHAKNPDCATCQIKCKYYREKI